MNCTLCHSSESFVVRTDAVDDAIRRRRECERCHHRWTTYEVSRDLVEELKTLKQALAPVAQLVQQQ